MPWQGDRYTALVAPGRAGRPPSSLDVHRCLEQMRHRGVEVAVTPALSSFDAQPFVSAGFRVLEHLHLLAYRLDRRDDHAFLSAHDEQANAITRSLRQGRPWHRRVVLDIDQRAFEPFWQFDTNSLAEARRATPTARYRVALDGRTPIGYAVTGRAGDRGYLQRLAVDPDHQGAGVGRALVHDCLRWLYSKGAGHAMVNTQERNTRALALYEHLGFARQHEGLVVLRWTAT